MTMNKFNPEEIENKLKFTLEKLGMTDIETDLFMATFENLGRNFKMFYTILELQRKKTMRILDNANYEDKESIKELFDALGSGALMFGLTNIVKTKYNNENDMNIDLMLNELEALKKTLIHMDKALSSGEVDFNE